MKTLSFSFFIVILSLTIFHVCNSGRVPGKNLRLPFKKHYESSEEFEGSIKPRSEVVTVYDNVADKELINADSKEVGLSMDLDKLKVNPGVYIPMMGSFLGFLYLLWSGMQPQVMDAKRVAVPAGKPVYENLHEHQIKQLENWKRADKEKLKWVHQTSFKFSPNKPPLAIKYR